MRPQHWIKTAAGASLTLAVITLISTWSHPSRVKAYDDSDEDALVQRGFQIAPVALNLEGKNRALVGLDSYIVNAVADCNGCHTAGRFPNFNYALGGNPYFGQPTKVDPTFYLSGGQDFGTAGTPTGSSGYAGPDIISRNLTPDKSGRTEGGHTLEEFKQIIRHGTDLRSPASDVHRRANCTNPSGHNAASQLHSHVARQSGRWRPLAGHALADVRQHDRSPDRSNL